jgi:hypothetical protein
MAVVLTKPINLIKRTDRTEQRGWMQTVRSLEREDKILRAQWGLTPRTRTPIQRNSLDAFVGRIG